MKFGELTDFLLEHAKEEPVSFHMPGHKGVGLYREQGYGEFLDRFLDCDITEIPGADNLFQAEGVIRSVMDRYARLYEVRKSYVLVNGTSGGIIASILAAVPRGGKLIMARNCHKSVFNAISLGGISPVYAYPETIGDYNIAGKISPQEIETLLEQNPDASAVILPSPNYYGICSDIRKISEAVHKANKVLIVDQAHGAHLKFFGRFAPGAEIEGHRIPKPAEEQGADIVINSTHKTLASFTQSAILNVVTERIDTDLLEERLQAIESSSPSYLLMASMDINADILERSGETLIRNWSSDLREFYAQARLIPGLRSIHPDGSLDFTKINIDMSAYGFSGALLEQLLIKERIYPELSSGSLLMLMTGLGSKKRHYEKLVHALTTIAGTTPSVKADPFVKAAPATADLNRLELCGIPEKRKKVKLEDAEGLVCATAVIPYPPGIPAVCPGERFTEEIISYIKALRKAGEKVIGVNEKGEILAGY